MTVSLELIVEILVFSAVALMTLATVREIERMLNQRRRLSGQGEVRRGSSTPLWLTRAGENAFFRWILASTSHRPGPYIGFKPRVPNSPGAAFRKMMFPLASAIAVFAQNATRFAATAWQAGSVILWYCCGKY